MFKIIQQAVSSLITGKSQEFINPIATQAIKTLQAENLRKWSSSNTRRTVYHTTSLKAAEQILRERIMKPGAKYHNVHVSPAMLLTNLAQKILVDGPYNYEDNEKLQCVVEITGPMNAWIPFPEAGQNQMHNWVFAEELHDGSRRVDFNLIENICGVKFDIKFSPREYDRTVPPNNFHELNVKPGPDGKYAELPG